MKIKLDTKLNWINVQNKPLNNFIQNFQISGKKISSDIVLVLILLTFYYNI